MTKTASSLKAVIIAGGSGTRLWPVSRKGKPKQFQAITSDKTMLQETYLRLRKRFAVEDIYISTNQQYVAEVEREILEIPTRNIIAEPAARNTAAGIALAAAVIAAHHGDDVRIAVFPADHLIKHGDVLLEAVADAERFLTEYPEYIVTLGLLPTYAETGYGYIKKGAAQDVRKNIFAVERFVEKPDADTAHKYVADGNYYWNAGMFIFVAGAMLAKFAKYLPNMYARIMMIKDAVDTPAYSDLLHDEYDKVENISVDYAILENDAHVAVVPVEGLGWSDVGSWAALKDALVGEAKKHFVHGEHIDFDSENLVVYGSKKPIVTIGTKNLVIVDTDDAILVCDRDKSQLVSHVVKALAEGEHKKII